MQMDDGQAGQRPDDPPSGNVSLPAPAFCPCICHHQPGVTHLVQCCDRPPLDPFAETSAVPQLQHGGCRRSTDTDI